MKYVSYVTLQKKYPGKIVALRKDQRKVVAAEKTTELLEKILKAKGVNPETCLFLGPIEKYKQISAY